MVKTFQCLRLHTDESHDLLQKYLFRENEKSLLHLLNNLAAALPLFFRERNRYILAEMHSVNLTQSCSAYQAPGCQGKQLRPPLASHPGSSLGLSILTASAQHLRYASAVDSDMVWITTMATCQASRAVVSIMCIHHDLITLMQLHLHRMGFLERKRSTTSQRRQQCSKILAKYWRWRVTFAELI